MLCRYLTQKQKEQDTEPAESARSYGNSKAGPYRLESKQLERMLILYIEENVEHSTLEDKKIYTVVLGRLRHRESSKRGGDFFVGKNMVFNCRP